MTATAAPVRLGIIGLGFGLRVHLPAFQSVPHCRITALCAPTEKRTVAAAHTHDIAHTFSDWSDLLAHPEVDAVSIAVPPALQTEIVGAAAAAQKHVFCEKPLATTLKAAKAASRAVAAAGITHAINFWFPEIDAWQSARTHVQEGRLGEVQHVSVQWQVESYAYRNRHWQSWKLQPEAGGGVLSNFGIHTLHYLEWLLGPMARLNARLDGKNGKGEPSADLWLEATDGTPATVSLTQNIASPPVHCIEIRGSLATLVLENRTRDYARNFSLGIYGTDGIEDADTLAADGAGCDAADGRIVATARIAARFIQGITAGTPVLPGLEEGLRAEQLLHHARQAARTGDWQDIAP